jgi:ribosomal protein S2
MAVIAIIDSDSNIKNADFFIPGNDDSRRSITLYCNLFANTIVIAKKRARKKY